MLGYISIRGWEQYNMILLCYEEKLYFPSVWKNNPNEPSRVGGFEFSDVVTSGPFLWVHFYESSLRGFGSVIGLRWPDLSMRR